MPKILLHICCGPCAAFPLKYLRENFSAYDVTGYFYNPNIHPYKEFLRRLEALELFAREADLPLVIDRDYPLEEFLTNVITSGGIENRCQVCYETRLQKTARQAKAEGFDAFSATLLVSPYQKHELIRAAGEKAARENNVEFCYFDFRPGWQEGVNISREMNLYRQPYCGCIFSEKDRYYRKKEEVVSYAGRI